MKMDTLWDESLGHRLKVERGMIVDSDSGWTQARSRDKRERSQSFDRNLNFSTISNEEDEFGFSRKKTARDPMSHRIIEKRRRDRMNNCLADLSRLVPTNYLKKGRGRIEKTEIIEMAIKHLKHLQAHPCKDPGSCEVAKSTEQDHKRQYRLGFQECLSEAVRFLVEIEGLYAGDGLCVRLVNHLQKHFDKLNGGLCYTQALSMLSSDDSKILPMDIEHSVHGVQLDNFSESQTATVIAESGHSSDIRPMDGFPNILKHEKDCSNVSMNGNFNESSEYVLSNGTSVVRVASQLREMLQNPGLPKDQLLHRASPNATITHPTVLVCGPQDEDRCDSPNPKNEEVYKFKNNIKHRFNADLRHQTASPTDSHSDHISITDDDMVTHIDTPKNCSDSHQSENYPSSSHNGHTNGNHTNGNHTNDNLINRTHINGNHTNGNPINGNHINDNHINDHHINDHHINGHHINDNHINGNHTNGHHTNGHHHPQRPFSPFPAVAELSVKIPERIANDTHHHQHSGHWETGSSCGSNPSTTPPVPRSNGSSSGYSTSGELPAGTKPKILHGGQQHSPNISPYSRTPDHVLNRSPSPQNSASQGAAQAVPIFALHPKGTFYIPLTIDSGYLAPYILGLEDLAPVLHPVSICVNFSLCHSPPLKEDKLNESSLQVRGPSQFLDRISDRFAYGERLRF